MELCLDCNSFDGLVLSLDDLQVKQLKIKDNFLSKVMKETNFNTLSQLRVLELDDSRS